MRSPPGLRRQITGALFLPTFLAIVIIGGGTYYAGCRLAEYLLLRQTASLMETLMANELNSIQAMDRGNDYFPSSGDLAESLGLTFLVGKEVPPSMEKMPAGLNLLPPQNCFILKKKRDNTLYILKGSLGEYFQLKKRLLAALMCAAGCLLALSLFWAVYISKKIIAPLESLTRQTKNWENAILSASPQLPEFPPGLLARNDELGALVRSMHKSGAKIHAYLQREMYFTGDASHELRTPLTIIQGCAELLEREMVNVDTPRRQTVKAALRRLEGALCGMNETVNALLILARSSQDAVLKEINISRFAAELLTSWPNARVAGSAKECASDNNRPPGLLIKMNILPQVIVKANPPLLKILIRNLLENSLRYSEDGIAHFTLTGRSIEIVNRGCIPIPGNIYARGIKGASSEGCGFGLSLASRICDLLSWRLEHESRPGITTFRVVFNPE